MLAIGDAIRTDIAGAAGQGLDALFVAAGIHREDLRGADVTGAQDQLQSLFARENLRPIAATYALTP